MARLALADANGDRDDSVPNVHRHFKRRCAEHGLPCDSRITEDALAEALAGVERERRVFNDRLRAIARVAMSER